MTAATIHPASYCPKPRRKYVLTVAVLGSSLGFIDGTIITVAIQSIRADLNASYAAALWVVNGYTLALAAFLLVGGAAGDRFGKRAVFGAGIAAFAVASAACALAPTVEVLIAMRVAQGLAAAMMVPGSLALIAVNFPPETRGAAVGLWAAASGITTALGPILGGVLIDYGSWPAIFLINLPIAALSLVLLYARVPADAPAGRERFDLLGAVLAFAGVGLVAAALTVAEHAGLTAPLVLALFAGGVTGLGLFIAWQASAPAPMMPLGLFARPTFSLANILTLLLYFALSGVLFFLPITLMEGGGWRAAAAGAVFLPFTIAMAVVSPLSGRLMDRFGARTLLVVGPLLAAAAFAVIPFFLASLITISVPMLALGIGMGLAIPPLAAAVLNDAGEARVGIASGVNNAVARVAGLLAVAMLGLAASWLFQATLGVEADGFAAPALSVAPEIRQAAIGTTFTQLAFVCAACAVAASAVALLLPRMNAARRP